MSMKLDDDARYTGMRKQLIGMLRQKNIRSERVLQAMLDIPRHYFIPRGLENIAYEDRAFSIGSGQTISQPFTVAFQSELLEVTPTDKVLEIGTGSGYQAAILGALAKEVHTIERQEELYLTLIQSRKLSRYPHIHLYFGDGYDGVSTQQPFDKILITAACESFPQQLFSQLKVGGYIVLPLGTTQSTQVMTRIRKITPSQMEQEQFGNFDFVPMLSGINKQSSSKKLGKM